MKKVIFVTGNKEKIAIAQNAVLGTNYEIIVKSIECKEIQADDTSDIAKYSAKFASDKLRVSVIKTDQGLFINALGGFPGPYSSYVERKLDCNEILKMLVKQKDRSAFYKESLAFCEYKKEPIVFDTYTHGNIAFKMQGKYGWNFDRFFVCKGDQKTMACFDDKQRIRKYNNVNWKNLIKYLEQEHLF